MIRIRAILGPGFLLAADRIEQVQEIFRQTFPELSGYAERIPSLLRDPVGHGYRSLLLVAENTGGRVEGFALLLHLTEARCCFLDFIAVRQGIRGTGIGGALYEAAREYSQQSGATALYIEVEPDARELESDPERLKNNRRRIRFYEQYGVRVIAGTDYDVPVGDPPTTALLLYDALGSGKPLQREAARRAVEMILRLRFGHVADPAYILRVVNSFRDDPVRFREVKASPDPKPVLPGRLAPLFAIVYTPRHEIHHVKERGYFERPIRATAIRESLDKTGLFSARKHQDYGEKPILAVHDADLLHYLQLVCGKLKEGRPVYSDTFPLRRLDRKPKMLAVQSGYYCTDTGTPLYRGAYIAARASANTALSAADAVISGWRLAYAACRPPGHHAGRRFIGGFCYFNNAAIAAQHLSARAKVAVLDVDFHHGNGTQDIFYERGDVLTVSIHGHPDYSYPYFTGYEDETGAGPGLGFNRNFPLPPETDDEKYLRAFGRAMEVVEKFKAEALVLSLGYDIMSGDPTGTFQLGSKALHEMGKRVMGWGGPVLVVQEGGYSVRNIRTGSAAFFRGCASSEK